MRAAACGQVEILDPAQARLHRYRSRKLPHIVGPERTRHGFRGGGPHRVDAEMPDRSSTRLSCRPCQRLRDSSRVGADADSRSPPGSRRSASSAAAAASIISRAMPASGPSSSRRRRNRRRSGSASPSMRRQQCVDAAERAAHHADMRRRRPPAGLPRHRAPRAHRRFRDRGGRASCASYSAVPNSARNLLAPGRARRIAVAAPVRQERGDAPATSAATPCPAG